MEETKYISIFGTFDPAGGQNLLSPNALNALIGKGLSVDKNTGEIIADMGNIIHVSNTQPENNDVEVWINDGGEPSPYEGLDLPEKITDALKELHSLSDRVIKIENIFQTKLDAGDASYTYRSQFENQPSQKPEYSTDSSIDTSINVIDIMEGNYDNVAEIAPTNTEELLAPNVHHICIKRGSKKELSGLLAHTGELYYCADENKLYVGYNNKWRPLTSSGGEVVDPSVGPDPSTGPGDENEELMKPLNQLTFIAETAPGESEGKHYVMLINNKGNLVIKDKTIIDAPAQTLNENYTKGIYLEGLYISNVYAGGYTLNDSTKEGKKNAACSHNFIQIYNDTSSPINLTGTSIQYSEGGNNASSWQVLPLKGVVPSKCAYLIRGAKCADNTLLQISNYDIDFPSLFMSDKKFKLYLTCKTTACETGNPSNILATSSNYKETVFDNGYIDFITCESGSPDDIIDAVDGAGKAYKKLKNISLISRTYTADFVQKFAKIKTFNTSKDFKEIRLDVDLSFEPTVEIYKPYYSGTGAMNLYYDKTTFNSQKPNTISQTMGLVPTTRCFNWTSKKYANEYLFYRRIKSDNGTAVNENWKRVESIKNLDSLYKRILVTAQDGTQYTVHKVILENLVPGEYEYYCGKYDGYSDINTFVVKNVSDNDAFDFLQITDQQGWNLTEYIPWKMAMEFIDEVENNKLADSSINATGTGKYDFLINTGDITQNGVRPNEWLDYYDTTQHIIGKYPHMTVVGNNDLCPTPGQLTGKNFPESFEYFNTYQHNPENIPWIDKNDHSKGTMKSVYSYDYGCVHFSCLNSNNYLPEQEEWLVKDIELAMARPTPPKFRVVVLHDGPFNIISAGSTFRNNRSNNTGSNNDTPIAYRYTWSRLMERLNIDLCLCGHKHTYSFSHFLRERVETAKIDASTGELASPDASLGGNIVELEVVKEPLNPLILKLGDSPETKPGYENYVLYVMSQATGFKLNSNVDTPAQDIKWLASYYPGQGLASKPTTNPEQLYPSYIRFNVLSNGGGIQIIPYKVSNIISVSGSTYSFDPYIERSEKPQRIANFLCEGISTDYYTLKPKTLTSKVYDIPKSILNVKAFDNYEYDEE